MAKLSTVARDTEATAMQRRQQRQEVDSLIADIDTMDNSRLSTWELDFIEKAADAGYVGTETIHKLEQIREKLERHERGRR